MIIDAMALHFHAFNIKGEAEPCVKITFLLQESNAMHLTDCVTTIAIGGLKHDLQDLFHLKGFQQIWLYENVVMEDNKSLSHYILDLTSSEPVEIVVKKG